MNTITVYDIQNKFIAYSAPYPDVLGVVSEWGSLYILSGDSKVTIKSKHGRSISIQKYPYKDPSYDRRHEKTGFLHMLISAFVFATRIVQFLYYLNPKFQASSHLMWLYSPVCMGPGRKPRRPVFSQRGSYSNSK